MARVSERLADNAPGDFFVDRTCIDCGMCRHIAPTVFAEAADHSYVVAQPADEAALRRAQMALIACPVSAIGTVVSVDLRGALGAFPEEVLPNVYFCGFASEASFGAAAWFIRRPDGNVLIDSPRTAATLLKRLEALGGVRWMFLTHRDDVADHVLYAKRFGAERILHVADRQPGTATVERFIEGDAPVALAPDLTIIPVPGHTAGSMGLLFGEDVFFSGDHLWGTSAGGLGAGRDVCWYDWAAQTASMERLREFPFGHVLPGHGAPWHGGAEAKGPALDRLIQAMHNRA